MKPVLFKFLTTIIVLVAFEIQSIGQVSWTTQYMGRAEYRHGYQTLADTAQDPAIFISQRARLGFNYSKEKFRIGISIQDIRTWGSIANLPIDNSGSFSVYEAWGELLFTKKLSFKFGRQPLAYDDDRIFGSLDWAMQGRRHDVALLKYSDSTFTADFGIAYNQDKEQTNTNVYTVANNYKALQFLWLKKVFTDFNVSALILNNGLQFSEIKPNGEIENSIKYSQTIGLRGVFDKKKMGANAAFYYQTGKNGANKNLKAYDASAEISYKILIPLKLTLGFELLSGTSQTDTTNKQNNSFNPFYGTNHRFNGYMDYFYAGNHINSVGLRDIYFKILYDRAKYYISVNMHSFASAANVRNNETITSVEKMNPAMGREIDFTIGYNFTDGAGIQAGYSQMFATSTMEMIKDGNKNETHNWAYLMILIRPGLSKFPRTGLKM